MSSMPADVVSLTIESANETPSPKLEPPIVPPNAFTVDTLVDAADNDASPRPTSTDAPERIASACDILVVVSNGPAPADLRALEARRFEGTAPAPERRA